MYKPTSRAPECITQSLIDWKGEIDWHTVTVEDLNIHSAMNTAAKRTINKETVLFNVTMDHTDLESCAQNITSSGRNMYLLLKHPKIFSGIS
jgi:hypothetical protein